MKKILNIVNYFKDIFFIVGDSKRKIFYMSLLFLGVSLLDLIGIGFIGIFASVFSSAQSDGVHQEMLQYFQIETSESTQILYLGILIFAVFLLKTVGVIFSNKTIIHFTQSKMVEIVSQMMRSYQKIPYADYLNKNTSEIIHNIQQVPGIFTSGVLTSFLRSISDGIIMVVIVTYLAWIDFFIFSILLAAIVGISYMYDFFYRQKIHAYGSISNKAVSKGNRGVIEGIEGLKEVRILQKEGFFYNIVRSAVEEHADARGRYMLLQIVPRYLIEITVITVVVIVMAYYAYSGQNMSSLLPILAVFGVSAIRLIPVANSLVNSLVNLRYGQDSVSRLKHEMLKSCTLEGEADGNYKDNDLLREKFSSLELKGVEFSYPHSSKKAIKGISLKIKSGDSIGIIGETGSGKSTLVDLILGLIQPSSGSICYNGVELTAPNILTKKAAYVPQKLFIIDDTLANNITLESDQKKVDSARLNDSLFSARLTSVVQSSSEGVQQRLGDKGVSLSGGQRQRVALARALYHDREILVMDEATNALDSATEQEIVDEVGRLKGSKTIILVAHNLSTLKNCDQIIKIQDGKVIQYGSYEEVILQEGV